MDLKNLNWKKFGIEVGVIAGVTAAALFYAPAFLAAEATAVITGAECGIAVLGIWGTIRSWNKMWKEASKQEVAVHNNENIVPQKQTTSTNQKEHIHEKTKKRMWIKAPKFICKWRTKNRQQDRENYRDAA